MIVQKCLQEDAKDRYQSFLEIYEELIILYQPEKNAPHAGNQANTGGTYLN